MFLAETSSALVRSSSSSRFIPQTETLAAEAVTGDNIVAFYHLLQEQAAVHGAAETVSEDTDKIAALLAGITNGDCHAFLVTGQNAEGQTVPMGAVTYFPSLTSTGRHMYLEDIVVSAPFRGARVVGDFALRELAHRSQDAGMDGIELICSVANERAERFYDHHGLVQDDQIATWRTSVMPTAAPATDATMRILTAEDPALPAVAAFLTRTQGQNWTAERLQSVLQAAETLPEAQRPFIQIGTQAPDATGQAGEIFAAAFAYPNFSTFRATTGMHVEIIHDTQADHSTAMPQLRHFMSSLGTQQRERGWTGHCDMLVPRQGSDVLQRTLRTHCRDAAELLYDGHPMRVWRLIDPPYSVLANRPAARTSQRPVASVVPA
jgi:ribosomal protein S18 acetylase RimI-like enzyme